MAAIITRLPSQLTSVLGSTGVGRSTRAVSNARLSAQTAIASRRRASPSVLVSASRPAFSTSAVRAAGKESTLERAQEVERAKQDQLRKQRQGKGEWKDELASDSESIVKADRGEIDASQATIEKLQKETEKMAEKERKG